MINCDKSLVTQIIGPALSNVNERRQGSFTKHAENDGNKFVNYFKYSQR